MKLQRQVGLLAYYAVLTAVFVIELIFIWGKTSFEIRGFIIGIFFLLLNLIPVQIPVSRFSVLAVSFLDVSVVYILGFGTAALLLGVLWVMQSLKDRGDFLQGFMQLVEKGALFGIVPLLQHLLSHVITSEDLQLLAVTITFYYASHLLAFLRTNITQKFTYSNYMKMWGYPQSLELIYGLLSTLILVYLYQHPFAGNLVALLFVIPALWQTFRIHIQRAKRHVDYSEYLIRERFIFNSIEYWIIAIDMNREIRTFNKKAQEFFEASEHEVIGKTYEEIFNSMVARKDRRLLHSLEVGASYSLRDYPVTINEQLYYLDIYTAPLKNDEGQMIGAVGVYRDVTQQKKLEEEILHKDRLSIMGQMAAGTVHEIRNPLAIAKGHLDLAFKKISYLEDSGIKRHLEIIQSQLDRSNYALNGLLSLAKPKPFMKTTVDVQELIDDSVEWTYHAAIASGIRLTGIEMKEEIEVEVDPDQIKQVLINLLYNAFDATSEGGSVQVWAEVDASDKFVMINVSDTGKGMSEAEVEKTGRAFYTTKETGTGLGLLISRQIVESHGGHLEIMSEVGIGTKLIIWLPLPSMRL